MGIKLVRRVQIENMATQADAEFRMMFMLKNMDLDQQGPVSSEDRLFMADNPRVQPQRPEVNPFGAVHWEQGRPIYQEMQTEQVTQEQQAQFLLQQQQQQQHLLEQQHQQLLFQQHQQMQQQHQLPPQAQQLFQPNHP